MNDPGLNIPRGTGQRQPPRHGRRAARRGVDNNQRFATMRLSAGMTFDKVDSMVRDREQGRAVIFALKQAICRCTGPFSPEAAASAMQSLWALSFAHPSPAAPELPGDLRSAAWKDIVGFRSDDPRRELCPAPAGAGLFVLTVMEHFARSRVELPKVGPRRSDIVGQTAQQLVVLFRLDVVMSREAQRMQRGAARL